MEHIVDLHGTAETEQDARDKATQVLAEPGYLLVISNVELRPQTHAAAVTYEYQADPNASSQPRR